jgi:predicted transposase YbfD/YdcC
VGVYDHYIPVEVYAVDEIDCGHGRVEQRKCSVIADLGLIEKAAEWASLKGLVRIESGRYHEATGKTEREIRYYITSLTADGVRLNSVIRQHWGIENKLHWVLDVARVRIQIVFLGL